MYNEVLKQKFIKENCTGRGGVLNARRVFNATEPYEEEADTDICAMSSDELKPIMDEVLGVFSNSRRYQIQILKKYANWCIESGVEGAGKGLFDVDIDGLEKIRSTMFSGPAHLQRCMDEILTPESMETTDVVSRSYFWMAFSGIREKDILAATKENIDFRAMCIRIGEKEYPIYREAVTSLHLVAELEDFLVIHPNYDPIRKARVKSSQLLRMTKAEATYTNMVGRINRKIRAARRNGIEPHTIQWRTAFMSGLFYRAYEDERAGYPPRFTEFVVENYSFKNKIEMIKYEEECKSDYERWKAAFM